MGVNLGTAVGYLDLDTSKFTMGFKQALTAVEGFKDGTSGVSSLLKGVSNGMATVGKDLTLKVTTPILTAGAAVVKTSASLEQSLSKVRAISGATGSDMTKLKDKAIEMGAKTKFSATEASDAFTYMAMAGWKTEDMLQGIDGIMNLSAADGLDLATTSDIVTDALTAFGLQAKDSAHFADVMATASSNANTNVSMLGESFKYVAPVAGSLGYSIEDTAVALGLMANSGIKASQAGTALRASLSNMFSDKDKVVQMMTEYGLSMTNADGSMKSLSEVMEMLREKLGGLSEAEQASTASILFGREAMSGMLAIINASPQDYEKLTEAISNADGTALDMANTMQDNLSGQITILKSNIESLAISLGDMIVPFVKDIIAKIQELVIYLNGLDDAQKEQIIQIAAVVAAIGPALLVLSKVVSVVSTIVTVLGSLSAPVLIVIAAITALYAAWQTNFMGIGDSINSLASTLQEKFDEIVGHIESIGAKAKELWENDFGGIRTVTENVIGSVSALIEGIASIISEVFSFIDNIINGDFEGAMKNLKNIAKIYIDTFIKFWLGIVTSIKTIVKNVVSLVIEFGKSIGQKMKSAAKDAVEKFISFMKNLPSNIGYFLGQALGKAVKWAIDFVKKGSEAGVKFKTALTTFLKNLPSNIATFLTNAVKKAIKFAEDFPEKAKDAAKDFKDALVEKLEALPEDMLTIGKNIVDGIVAGIGNAIDSAKEAIGDFAGGIVDGFKDALGIHSPSVVMKKQVGVQIANGIIEGIKSKKDAAKKSAAELSNEILSAAEKKLNKLQAYNKISLYDEVFYWKKVYDATKKGSDANLTAYKNYVSAKKSYNQELSTLETEYKDKVSSVYDDLKTKVDSLTKSYKDQVESRKSSLLSSFSLFSKYGASADEDQSDLTSNLKSQVDALKKYNKQMSELEGRNILPQSLIEELRKQGLSATDELEVLNSLTDEKLKEYAKLWNKRDKLAQEEAERENKDAYDKLQSDIEKANQAALSKIDSLNAKYNKKINKLGGEAYDASLKAGKKTGQGIVDGLKEKNKAINKTLKDIVNNVNSYMQSISSSLASAKSSANEIASLSGTSKQSSTKSTKKTHRQGLTYVPYDGYEAILHEGEQVLTKEEANNRSSGDTFIFNSPKAIDEKEAVREMKRAKQQLALSY